MKNIQELIDAIYNKTPLIWNNPDPIRGDDYTINFIGIFNIKDFDKYTPILIQYGGGSEAEVYLHEIIKKIN